MPRRADTSAADVATRPNIAASPIDRARVGEKYGQAIRWREGERLDHLFEAVCESLREEGRSDHPAVDAGGSVLTHGALDARANQVARYLLARGARAGDRIALLFDQPVLSYVAMLATLKINAAYVPMDAGFPPDRLAYIVRDSGARYVVAESRLRPRLRDVAATPVYLDEISHVVDAQRGHRLTDAEKGRPVDQLCYIVYTSGSTGRPKGVAVDHASICNFVRVAVDVYGIESHDRVYQGLTIAFDFSVEEIWVPLLAGATLVPKPDGTVLVGEELWRFLHENGVTALCCVPTLLSSIDEELPRLRFLLLSGEACPQDLIRRWYRPGRRVLNVYGPTEATVSATWWVCTGPDQPVNLGVALPTYSTVILDPDRDAVLPDGVIGEIGIAGVGLARGYVNRDDLTARAFIGDFVGLPNNPSCRIYRTGDLGRVNAEGEIEYHGRIDTQVKIRGYRIELAEIESVLLETPGVAQAVVETHRSETGLAELVGYYSLRADAAGVDPHHLRERLRERLPSYMVPTYFEQLAAVPTMPSGKADRSGLPAPKTRLRAPEYAAPATGTERMLTEVLAQVLRLDQVSTDSHFFDDLGADSLLMARVCAEIRRRAGVPSVSMRDVYLHPTARSLATVVDGTPGADTTSPAPSEESVCRPSTVSYVCCGIVQGLFFLGYAYATAVAAVAGYSWTAAGSGMADTYLRALVVGCVAFAVLCVGPVVAKWLLVGRWQPGEFPVWSPRYVRFWAVKTLIRASPLTLFVGSPLYTLYLRALGAKVGRRVVILSRNIPVCTDLLTVGAGTVIRKESAFACYRAHSGRIQTGAVSIGAGVVVGEMTVLDIDTSLGDGAQLGHASSLHAGQAVPAGQCWHGSPAGHGDAVYRRVPDTQCGVVRRFCYGAAQLVAALLVYSPVTLMVAVGLADVSPLANQPGPGHTLLHWASYRDMLIVSAVLLFGGALTGLAFVTTVPRLLNLALRPDTVYPLYGVHYWIQRTVSTVTNVKFFTYLFGDSSYIVHYLRTLGYDLSRVEQTGSNFGMTVRHESPYLSTVGSGTMASDGLSFVNADFSSTSFRVSRVSIGPRNFLGNNVTYPAHGRTGDNCLLATKVMIPIDGEVREGVGLLGSPPFEIPRSVRRDAEFDAMKSALQLRPRLAAKNRHNLATIGLFLLVRWLHVFALTVLAVVSVDLYNLLGAAGTAAAIVLGVLFTAAYFVLVERAVTTLHPLRPRFCSIYDLSFWRHERYWKVPAMGYVQLFNGTPYKNTLWRLLGVRIGRRVFDDGCWMTERPLVAVGDDCTLNAGTTIQCHSLEDATFKSDHVRIGNGCTIGAGAFVHYGVAIGDRAVLSPDSFLMKGEQIAAGTSWAGNPARASGTLGRPPSRLP